MIKDAFFSVCPSRDLYALRVPERRRAPISRTWRMLAAIERPENGSMITLRSSYQQRWPMVKVVILRRWTPRLWRCPEFERGCDGSLPARGLLCSQDGTGGLGPITNRLWTCDQERFPAIREGMQCLEPDTSLSVSSSGSCAESPSALMWLKACASALSIQISWWWLLRVAGREKSLLEPIVMA